MIFRRNYVSNFMLNKKKSQFSPALLLKNDNAKSRKKIGKKMYGNTFFHMHNKIVMHMVTV